MIHYQKRTLHNGLTVIVEQDQSTSLAAVNVLYKVGSRDESPSKTGFAHLFEHLMFGGSKHAPDFDTPLQSASGENNAYTNNDYTNYYDVVPYQNIETALWLEADRMSNLVFNSKTLSLQKKVVIEEFKEVCLNKPYGDSWHHLSELAYKKHPYSWPTIGKTIQHIKNARLADVKSFYKKHYHPSNAILSVSGPLDPSLVFDLVDKWFGSLQSPTKRKVKTLPKEPVQDRFQSKLIHAPVPSRFFIMAYHMPERNHPDYYACDLLTDILANGRSARLYSNLVRKKQLMSQIDCYVTGTFDPGLIVIEGRPMNEISNEVCISEVKEELKLLRQHYPTERELQKVKNKVISSLAMSDLNVLNKAISLAYFEWLGALDLMNQQEHLFESVTLDDILRVIDQYVHDDNMTLIEYHPLDETKQDKTTPHMDISMPQAM